MNQLRLILNVHGMRAAIIFLNHLTDHRYTSVFIFDGPHGRHAFYYDRENAAQVTAPDTLVEMSYCIYVRKSASLFEVNDATTDERVGRDHPKKELIRSYCGIPLIDGYGNVLGSACHYDPNPKPTAPEDVELLEMFSRIVPRIMSRS